MQAVCLDNLQSVLCIGAHADDIEIGCGGTLLQLLEKRKDLAVTWVVLSADGTRKEEAQRSAEAFLDGCPQRRVMIDGFQDARFPAQWAAIKDRFATLAAEVKPDLIFTHRLEDRHQDHRLVSELTWNHFRSHMVLEYEIPKYEGDLTTPNVYVGLEEATVNRKVELLREHFDTQQAKPWFTDSTFEALMRIRGLESGCDSGLAEGFHARKLLLSGPAIP